MQTQVQPAATAEPQCCELNPPQVAVAQPKIPGSEAPTPAAAELMTPEMQALIESLARQMAQAMSPAMHSPPPRKETKEEQIADPAPAASAPVLPAAGAPAPPALHPASASAPLVPAKAASPPANPNRINSSTHPAEYKEFGRFCEANPAASELKEAYMSETETDCMLLRNTVGCWLACETIGRVVHSKCKLSRSTSKRGVSWAESSYIVVCIACFLALFL